ncbi:MAG: MFS transporter [Candidatus Latescibacteria bacterium]|nr:MFS transporter [Candidatus Latescibacterota bacterium]
MEGGSVVSWKRNFYVLWITEVIAILGFQCIQPFLPFYIQKFLGGDLGHAAVWAGWLGTAGGMGMAIFSPIWGAVADRVGRKPMVARAMIGGGLTVFLMILTRSVEQLLVVRFLQGALAGTVTACIALASTTVPKNQLGFALGTMQMGFLMGNAAGPLFGGVVIDHFGYTLSFVLSGTLILLAGCCVYAFVVEDFRRPSASSETQWKSHLIEGIRPFLSNQPYIIMLVSLTLIQFTFSVVIPIFPLFVQQLAHTEKIASLAGGIFALSGVTGAISSVLLGRFSDRIGYRRTLVAGIFVAGTVFFAHAFVRSVFELAVLRVLLGLTAGAINPVVNAMIAGFIPEKHRGKAFGLTSSASAISWATGPVIGGHLGATWGFRSVFVVTAALFVGVGTWVLAVVKEPQHKDIA